MTKGSKFGRQQQEEVWQNAEVDGLYRLSRAVVRVPQPYGCLDGVLLMELVIDDEGDVATRLADVHQSHEQAMVDHKRMMKYDVLLLEACLIYRDLSSFN